MSKSEKSLIKPSSNFFETVGQLEDKIKRRAFEIFEERDGHQGDHLADWFAAESDILVNLALSVEEDDEKIVVRGDLPDFRPGEIDVQIEGNTLSVVGRHVQSSTKNSKDGTSNSRSEINFLRRVSLSDDVDRDAVEARFEDGELRVVIPRREA